MGRDRQLCARDLRRQPRPPFGLQQPAVFDTGPSRLLRCTSDCGIAVAAAPSPLTKPPAPPPAAPPAPDPPPGPPLPAGFAEAYTLSGCADSAHCGTFHRVAARCASGDHCPGGQYDYSGTDPSLCNGAPVYQKGSGDGPVLSLADWGGSGTRWVVTDSSALETCNSGSSYLFSAYNDQAGGDSPKVPAYNTGSNGAGGTGWVDIDASPSYRSGCGCAIVAGGR